MRAASPDLAAELSDLPARRGRFPWEGHEYVRGWGVFALPFDSGHVLGLRVFPENDFAPFVSVWHRMPGGEWSIYADGPRLDTACPRYFGPACATTALASVAVEWTGPGSVRVVMEQPRLDWTFDVVETATVRWMNRFSRHMPLWTWRLAPLLRAREVLASRLVGMGKVTMRARMPSGHTGTLMPMRVYLVSSSSAVLEGEDLGRPTRSPGRVTIGEVGLPERGVLAVGQGAFGITDADEYESTRAALERAALVRAAPERAAPERAAPERADGSSAVTG